MRIGIDIDDTIINTTATIIECGLEYDRLYKEGRGLKNADAFILPISFIGMMLMMKPSLITIVKIKSF